jgi:glycerol uptake facilitator-like aquaporin
MTAPLTRRLLAEFLGSALLSALVIGSGIAAAQLSDDGGLQLLENAAATAAGLYALILVHLLAEVVATCGLVLVIFALVRSDRSATAPAAVGAYIGAAYWFTSSTSFANPAISIGRMFSDTFAGIAPASVPPFIVAQLIGGLLALVLVRVLYPSTGPAAVLGEPS